MTRPNSPGDVLRPSIHQDVLGTGDTCPMPAQQCHPASRAATRQPCGNRLQPHATKNDREVTVWAGAHQPHGTSRRAPVPYVPGQQLNKKRQNPSPMFELSRLETPGKSRCHINDALPPVPSPAPTHVGRSAPRPGVTMSDQQVLATRAWPCTPATAPL